MWRSYFPHARIHGIDIEDKSPHAGRRITIHRGDQTDPVFLKSVIEQSGTPDVIIDDGSHRNQDVIASFRILFPFLSSDGYIVEDTQTSYWPEDGNVTDRNDPKTTMGFLNLWWTD